MSTYVVDESTGFVIDEQKLKTLINLGFDLDKKCAYEALALKLEFNKVIVKIRQLIEEYKDQEFPDIYEHLKMIRATNETFQNWAMMNVGNVSGTNMGSPRAKSTPKQHQSPINQSPPYISIQSPTRIRAAQNHSTPPNARAHQRTYNAVRNFQNTLDLLQIPRNSSKARSISKSPTFNVSRTRLPARRRMNFS